MTTRKVIRALMRRDMQILGGNRGRPVISSVDEVTRNTPPGASHAGKIQTANERRWCGFVQVRAHNSGTASIGARSGITGRAVRMAASKSVPRYDRRNGAAERRTWRDVEGKASEAHCSKLQDVNELTRERPIG